MVFRHTATISRRQKIEGKGLASEFQTVAEDVPCFVIPDSEQDSLQRGVSIGKNYSVYFRAGVAVREADKIVTSTGVSLYVGGIADYKDIPRIGHIRVSCTTTGD